MSGQPSDDPILNEYEEQMGYLRIESSLRNYGNFALRLVEDKRRHFKRYEVHLLWISANGGEPLPCPMLGGGKKAPIKIF